MSLASKAILPPLPVVKVQGVAPEPAFIAQADPSKLGSVSVSDERPVTPAPS